MEREKRLSEKQVRAFKCLILNTKETRKIRKILFALFEASNELTKPVAFTSYSRKTVFRIDNFMKFGGGINWHEIMQLLNADFNPNPYFEPEGETDHCEWHFDQSDGYFSGGEFIPAVRAGKEYSRTIWLTYKNHDPKAMKISSEQVDKTELNYHLYGSTS